MCAAHDNRVFVEFTFGVHVNTGKCQREDETLAARISKYISLKSPICIVSNLSAVLSLSDTT